MILSDVCIDVISLKGTIDAPQSNEKGLRQLGIVWSHLPQYQKGGVQKVFLINHSYIIVCH